MRFLIDECLHTLAVRAQRTFGLCASLVELAHEAGHLCDHVNFLGLSGYKDWQLMATTRKADYEVVKKCGDTAGAHCSGTSFGRLPAMSRAFYSFHIPPRR
jgi:hypothetical protein